MKKIKYKNIKFSFLSFQNYHLYDIKFRRLSEDNKTYEVQLNHTIFLLSWDVFLEGDFVLFLSHVIKRGETAVIFILLENMLGRSSNNFYLNNIFF